MLNVIQCDLITFKRFYGSYFVFNGSCYNIIKNAYFSNKFESQNSMIDVSINKKGTRVHTLNFCMNNVINFKVR